MVTDKDREAPRVKPMNPMHLEAAERLALAIQSYRIICREQGSACSDITGIIAPFLSEYAEAAVAEERERIMVILHRMRDDQKRAHAQFGGERAEYASGVLARLAIAANKAPTTAPQPLTPEAIPLIVCEMANACCELIEGRYGERVRISMDAFRDAIADVIRRKGNAELVAALGIEVKS